MRRNLTLFKIYVFLNVFNFKAGDSNQMWALLSLPVNYFHTQKVVCYDEMGFKSEIGLWSEISTYTLSLYCMYMRKLKDLHF